MNLAQNSALLVDEIRLGHWSVRVSGPGPLVRTLIRVLRFLELPDDALPPLLVMIAPNGQYATGSLQGGGPQWSVDLPQHGWLSVVAGQVVASVAAALRRLLFIHAGVVAFDGRGLIIVGQSGAGKTSTVAALVRRGGIYFSDEVALLDPTTRTVHPFAFPMAVKPWTKKAAGRLPPSERIAEEGRVQYLLPARPRVEPVPVDAFVLLKPTHGRTQFTSISRAEMLLNIAAQSSSFSYRHRREEAFAGFGRLLRTARCYILESASPASAVGCSQEILFQPPRGSP